MTPDLLRQLVSEASNSPSVHNVQPARWRIDGGTLVLLEDVSRRLGIGDPTGHDAAVSLGAAAEGLAIAASRHGLHTRVERCEGTYGALRVVARLTLHEGGVADPLAEMLDRRASWRGAFIAPTAQDRERAAALQGEDRTVIDDPAQIARLGRLCDAASYGFMANDAFRAELLGWMRLRQGHPCWARDGLNAEAMQMSSVEALGAGLVLGPLFRPLAAIGLAPHVLAERKSFADATAVVLFHRPSGEDPFESGRSFHRLWLEIEKAGFGANVLAALADDLGIAAEVAQACGMGDDRRLVSAFRIGRRRGEGFARARLPLDEVLVG